MPEQQYFEYGEKEIAYLKSRDPLLGAVIDEIGHINRAVIPDMFMALVNVIVGQQISAKAQATVWARMREQFVPMTPETIGAITAEELQTCGISLRKAFYIKEIADSVLNGSLVLAYLSTLSDEEVCNRLSQIKGIGVWTAEMLMTFSLQRPNVMSFDDLAILRGLRMLYHHRKITPVLFAKYKRRYSPYATVASLYLWAIAGGSCPGLADYAPKSEAQKKADTKKRRK
ncbi:MAG: DNA-3-methyladenine glycosylase [Candidatus Dichloromethanomonas elyunquensis]|nr:MAG: DNA-3-methyladenine glycosylase [Candidatus Dichloromethanomonas elyunquensis]